MVTHIHDTGMYKDNRPIFWVLLILAAMVALAYVAYVNFQRNDRYDMRNESSANSSPAASVTTKNTAANWDMENSFWFNNYSSRPYYDADRDYTVYEPAYRYGVDIYNLNNGRPYTDLDQDELNRGWTQARGDSLLSWEQAELAARDSYTRIYNRIHPANAR